MDPFERDEAGIGSPSSLDWDHTDLPDEWSVSPVEAIQSFFSIRAVTLRKRLSSKSVSEMSLTWRLVRDAKWLDDHTALVIADVQKAYGPLVLRVGEFVVTEDQRQVDKFVVAEDQKQYAEARLSQLSFPLKGAFAPSKSLTDFWVRGVKAFAQRANTEFGINIAYTDSEVQQEFAKMLNSLLGTIGQQLRYGINPDVAITRQQRFLLEYQIKICDRFLIIPDEATTFLQTLQDELLAAILAGSTIEGAWGRIIATQSGELCYLLSPPTMVQDSSFVRSEEVE